MLILVAQLLKLRNQNEHESIETAELRGQVQELRNQNEQLRIESIETAELRGCIPSTLPFQGSQCIATHSSCATPESVPATLPSVPHSESLIVLQVPQECFGGCEHQCLVVKLASWVSKSMDRDTA